MDDRLRELYSLHKLSSPLVQLIADYAQKVESVPIAGREEAGFANDIGDKAEFGGIAGICQLLTTGNLLVSDIRNHQIRHIDIETQAVTTYAGSSSGCLDGAADVAKFFCPAGLACDSEGIE